MKYFLISVIVTLFAFNFSSCDITEDPEISGCFANPQCIPVKLVDNCCSVIRFSPVVQDSLALDLNISPFIAKNYCQVGTQLSQLNLTNEELKEKIFYLKIEDRELLPNEINDCAICEMYCPNEDPALVISVCGVKDDTEDNTGI